LERGKNSPADGDQPVFPPIEYYALR
jgi:hypothetical protein